jgi:nicotinate-nucleotide pyrophosphorylase (carboxylating)
MLDTPLVRSLVKLALREDLSFGDITSELTIPAQHRSSAVVLAREKLVVCGLEIIGQIFSQMRASADVKLLADDGDVVKPGTELVRIEGKTRDLLAAERTILNFLQRMSGIATHTKKIIDEASGLTVLDTRKTTPGWRIIEKYAVQVGGGSNHRFHLGDMILVKNNHVDAHGGDMRVTLKTVNAKKPRYMPVEIEVRSMAELKTALEFNPQVIMLDNMDDPMIRQALKIVDASGQSPLVEISGGVRVDRFKQLKKLGVKCVSMGSLTSQATSVDISMRIRAAGKKKATRR